MGFETDQPPQSEFPSPYLKYPYGIWNAVTLSPDEEKKFEVSLWDLKRFCESFSKETP